MSKAGWFGTILGALGLVSLVVVLIVTGGASTESKSKGLVVTGQWELKKNQENFSEVQKQFPDANQDKIEKAIKDLLTAGYTDLPHEFPADKTTLVDYSSMKKFLHPDFLKEFEFVLKDPESEVYKGSGTVMLGVMEALTPISISEGRRVALINENEYVTSIREPGTRYEITPGATEITYGVLIPDEDSPMLPEFTATVQVEIKVFFTHPETQKQEEETFLRDVEFFFFPDKDTDSGFALTWVEYQEELVGENSQSGSES